MGVSRIVRVVHDRSGPGRRLVAHFSLSRVRTRTVLRVGLHRLTGLRRVGVHNRRSRLTRRHSRLRGLLNSRHHLDALVGGRVLTSTRGFNSSHHSPLVRHRRTGTLARQSLVPDRAVAIILSSGN